MKLMMFAALAAAVAMPALAQTTPAPADTTMAQPAPAADPAASAAPMTPVAGDSTATPMPATGTYPMCSRTVTDSCTERSNAKGERMHSTPRPHKR